MAGPAPRMMRLYSAKRLHLLGQWHLARVAPQVQGTVSCTGATGASASSPWGLRRAC